MTGCIAVLNAGSSSIKFALYEAGRAGALLFRGQVEHIGRRRRILWRPTLRARPSPSAAGPSGELDHQGATNEILKLGARAPGRPARARVRPSRRPRRHGIRGAGPRRRERAGRARDAGAAGAAAPAAQSRAHRVHRRGGARHPAGRLLRHRIPSFPGGPRAGIRPAARAYGGRRAPLRLPRPVVRVHRVAAAARSHPALATVRA